MGNKVIVALVVFALTALLVVGSGLMLNTPEYTYEVTFDGNVVGYVTSLEEYQEILEEVLANAEEQWGYDLVLNEEVMATRTSFWEPDVNPEVVQAMIQEAATYSTTAWALKVDGEVVAFIESEDVAYQLLEEVKENYIRTASNRKVTSAEIQEDIEVSQQPIDPEKVLEREEVLALLLTGDKEITSYMVRRGDTLSGIARSHNTSISSLREANPNLSGDNLQIGQVLNLQKSNAILHVTTVEELAVTESIPRTVQYRANPDMSVRGDQVVQAGSDGVREVKYKIESINGVEVRRSQISSSITKQPEPRIVMTGIGQWPDRPTGMFRFPMNTGRISSAFGVRRGSTTHRGVDIAAPRGTPIYAAADGVVRTRAWGNSYGWYVVLDHSNGYSTLYAHASSIPSWVQPGTRVVRGQVIAYVGSTGNSTGNHLHWEVSRNGQLLNPMNFFRR